MNKKSKKKASKSEKIVSKGERFDNTKFYIQNGIDIENRRVVLDEEVDEYSTGWIMRAVQRMIDEDATKPIDLYINSYGGSVYDMLALYDMLEASAYTKVRTHATGKIMSAGMFLFLVGDERYASPRATFMAHTIASATEGKLFEMDTEVKECKRLVGVLLDILESRTDKTKAWWKKEIEHEDKYYSKDKALKLGVVTSEKFPDVEPDDDDEND